MLLPGSILSRLAGAGRLAAFVGVLVACAGVYAQKPEQILNRVPGQADVDVDYPADADVDKCVTKPFREQGYTGIALYAPDGTTLLRVWAAPAPKSGQKRPSSRFVSIRTGLKSTETFLVRKRVGSIPAVLVAEFSEPTKKRSNPGA